MEERLEEKIQNLLDSTFDEKIGAARRELGEQLRDHCLSHLESAVGQARQQAREEAAQVTRELAKALSAAGREIRGKESVTDIALTLVEAASRFCGRAALFVQKEKGVLGFRTKGFSDPKVAASFQQFEVSLSESPAIGKAVQSRQPVAATGSSSDVSQAVADLFGLQAEDKIYLFPIILRDKVLAVLYVDGHGANAEPYPAAIEVLTNVTEAWLEAVGTRKKQHEAAATR
jgi:hypothetical protein